MKASQKGLTLLELVMVLLLVSIAMSTLLFGNEIVKEITFKAKVNEVVSAMESTKLHAAASGKNYNVFCLEDQIIFTKLSPRTTLYKITLDQGISVDPKSRLQYFSFHGSMAPTGAFTIILNQPSLKQSARITIGVATGKVRIYYEPL